MKKALGTNTKTLINAFVKRIASLCLLLFLGFSPNVLNGQVASEGPQDYNQLSRNFLQRIKLRLDTGQIQKELAEATINDLRQALRTDEQKLAFWINVYNAYIQVILFENPHLYKDKASFFKAEQIPIAGRNISFEKIENGLLRKSQWSKGLGLVRKWFPDEFERELRVEDRDYRVHFALNCGARDCPPLAIYQWTRLNEQLDMATREYLKKTSKYYPDSDKVAVTPMFKWFTGDFGLNKGVRKILMQNKVIPTDKGIQIVYKDYDWTLNLENWE